MQYDALQCVNGSLFRCQTGNINVTESVVSKRRSPRLPTVGTNVFVVLDIIPFVVVANKITHNVIFVEFAVNYHLAEVKRDFLSALAIYAQAHHSGIVLAEVVDVAVTRRDYSLSRKPSLFTYRLDIALAEFTVRSFDDNRFFATRQCLARRSKQLGATQTRVVSFACAYVVKHDCRVV